jgi:hypothetical protein
VEPGEAALLDAIRVRARGDGWMTDADVRVEARARWLFGTWLAAEARRLRLPVVDSRPWDSLIERLLRAADVPP